MRTIKEIIVHASDQATNYPGLKWREPFVDAESIRRFHVDYHGWGDIGYHWVVLENGTVEPGRPEQKMGAHVRGHNKYSIGVVVITQDDKGRFTIPSLNGLRKIVFDRLKEYNLSVDDIYPHNYYDKTKTCPGCSRKNLLTIFGGSYVSHYG